MNQNEILNVIDCTPTWQALFQPMLDLYAQNAQWNHSVTDDKNKEIAKEFEKMAIAADKWNEYCKNVATSK